MNVKQAKITVSVQPGARKTEISGFRDGILRVKVSAPPVEGKANQALIKLLGNTLGIAKSNISIIKGTAGRLKTVEVDGMDTATLSDKITGILNGPP